MVKHGKTDAESNRPTPHFFLCLTTRDLPSCLRTFFFAHFCIGRPPPFLTATCGRPRSSASAQLIIPHSSHRCQAAGSFDRQYAPAVSRKSCPRPPVCIFRSRLQGGYFFLPKPNLRSFLSFFRFSGLRPASSSSSSRAAASAPASPACFSCSSFH